MASQLSCVGVLAFSVNDPARIFIHLLSVTAGYADWLCMTHSCGVYMSIQNPCHFWGFAQLKELKTELAALRVAKVTGGAPNKLSKM